MFKIVGFNCDPSSITSAVQLEPTETWRAGDQIGPMSPGPKWKFNGWRLHSPIDEPFDLEAHLVWFLEHIPADLPERLATVARAWEVVFSFIVEAEYQTPGMYFGAAVLQRVAALGASLDIDFYILGAE